MNRLYRSENEKDRFIVEHLLSYFIQYLEKSEKTNEDIDEKKDEIARMYIFPFRTKNGVRLGSLKEGEKKWYFAEEKEKVSSGSYRILADSIMKPDQVKKLRQIYEGQIEKFSDKVVIEDLIKRMSGEKEYSEIWWTCAYDVFRLWDPQKYEINLSEASRNINNNFFFFEEGYIGYTLKTELIHAGVFRDVLTDTARRLFWNLIPGNKKVKAIYTMKCLGIPLSFVYSVKDGYGYSKECINPYILKFVEEIGIDVDFRSKIDEEERWRCNLSHRLFMDIIYNESQEVFEKYVFSKDSKYRKGIVVKNTAGKYVPLYWDLFYAEEEVEKERTDIKKEAIQDKKTEDELAYLRMEYLHVDVSLYDPVFIKKCENIHAFSEVCEEAEEYGIDEEDTIDFCRWVWDYSKHSELAENILWHFSEDENGRITVDRKINEFVLSVIACYEGDERDFSFDIDIPAREAFLHADVINSVKIRYDNIFVIVYTDESCEDNGEIEYKKICSGKLDVGEYVKRILDAVTTDFNKDRKIRNDGIWEHVYVIDGDPDMYDGIYVNCKVYNDDYEDAIILWRAEDEDSYVRALAHYVHDVYWVDVDINEAESFDWKNEYLKMIRDIRGFLSETHEIVSMDQIEGSNLNMADVTTFAEEKNTWNEMKKRRDIIISQVTGSMPIVMDEWRTFLASKYKGRCQLCSKKIATGGQNSYFWTYRMVKEHDNKLANSRSNLFCLCPACHGEMQYGSIMGKDMSELVKKAQQYAEYIERILASDEIGDSSSLLIEEFEDKEKEYEHFMRPIVCDVIVNGKQRHMMFSWEHFMRIAFVFSATNNYDESEIKEMETAEEEEIFDDEKETNRKAHNMGGYKPWHGTEYVSGHWRTRNGHTEWVSGHWRTR